jgi:hypothetical protein
MGPLLPDVLFHAEQAPDTRGNYDHAPAGNEDSKYSYLVKYPGILVYHLSACFGIF